MRILASIEALTVTGPARNLLEFAGMARALPEPIHVTLVTFRRAHHAATDPFLEAAAKAGIPVEVLIERGPFDRLLLPALRELAARVDPDIVQTHGNKSHFLMRLSGLAKQRPWVAFHHGYTTPTRRQQAYDLLDRWSLRQARQVVTVTSSFLPELARAGVARERITIVPNSIRADWIAPATARNGIPQLVAVGRLSKEKAQADLLMAAAELRKRGQVCEVTLVGEGHEREALTARAAQLQVPVHFAGQVTDVRPFLAQASVFVMPSLSEGSPNALLEAMAAGLPIVATRVGGIPQTVTEGREALLVAPAQPAALAQAIERLLTDAALAGQLAAAARLRIEREFTPQARLATLAGFYKSIAGSAGRT